MDDLEDSVSKKEGDSLHIVEPLLMSLIAVTTKTLFAVGTPSVNSF